MARETQEEAYTITLVALSPDSEQQPKVSKDTSGC
jgi:hypothetical protein